MRLRHVEELASELVISQNQYWGRHRSEVEDEPVASLEDLEWADGVALGTPTRFGNVAAQLEQFMDQAGRLWQQGKLADKVATAFTSSMTTHGGQESTILALRSRCPIRDRTPRFRVVGVDERPLVCLSVGREVPQLRSIISAELPIRRASVKSETPAARARRDRARRPRVFLTSVRPLER